MKYTLTNALYVVFSSLEFGLIASKWLYNTINERCIFPTRKEQIAKPTPCVYALFIGIYEKRFIYSEAIRPENSRSCLDLNARLESATGSKFVALKGLSGFFPKCCSYSVERVDEGGWPQQSKVFFLKIALLANASPSKLIRLPASTSASRLQVLFQISLYPHWLNIGWRLFNDWLRILRYQISAHFTR